MSRFSHSDLYDFLNLAEDYLLDGFRRDHPLLQPSEQAAGTGAGLEADLGEIARQILSCRRCALHRERTQAVPGEGVPRPLVMVVGEGPGLEEDRSGKPFVGRAGQYLDRWLAAIGLDRRRNCFIANVVKCRPPGNRDPLPEESAACLPYLEAQIRLLKPGAILTVGRISTQILTASSDGIGQLRGTRHDFAGIPLIATYHPSAVLRNAGLRAPVWEDLRRLKALLQELGAPEAGDHG